MTVDTHNKGNPAPKIPIEVTTPLNKWQREILGHRRNGVRVGRRAVICSANKNLAQQTEDLLDGVDVI